MAPETVLEHLTSVLQTEQVPAEQQALRLLARAARGSMRDALSLTDQAIAFGNGELLETGVRQMLGSVDRGHVFKLIEALAQGDGKTVVETSEALRVDGMSAASTLEEMTAVLQAMAVLQAVPSRAESADSATDPDAADTARLATLMPADETQLLYSLCLHGRGELGLAPDEYAALTMVLLRLLAFKPSNAAAATASTEKKTLNEAAAAAPRAPVADPAPAPVAATPRPPAQAPAAVAPAPVAPAAPVAPIASAAPAAPTPPVNQAPAGQRLAVVDEPRHADPRPTPTDSTPAKVVGVPIRVQPPPGARDEPHAQGQRAPFVPIPPSEDGDFWYATVTQLVASEAIAALARELALQSQLVGRDTDQWMLRIERETLNQPSSREKLTAALNNIGHDVKLSIEIGSVVDSPARRNKHAAEERQRVAEDAILSDPEVQALMRDFDAKIVPGTLKPV
jgi:DNA polymerase-3 subunit gamma/tau